MVLHYNGVKGSLLDIKKDRRTEVFNFGADNAYPSLIEALISMSVTSRLCTDKAAKAIYGKSFGEDGNVSVNSSDETLNEVLRIAAREYAKHNNLYIHVSYNANLEISGIKVIPSTHVRLGKDDDRGYSGKYIVYDNWGKDKGRRIESSRFLVVDKYSSDDRIVQKQIDKAGKIESYNGQIMHVRKDSHYKYSLSQFNTVLPEMLLESNSQIFRSRGAEVGFLNVKLLVVPPFKDDTERRAFKKKVEKLRGAENAGSVMLLELTNQTDDVSKQIDLSDLSGNYNDELFKYSDEQAEKNICKAMEVPLMLVDNSDSSLFGGSGELLREAKLQLWESREEDRDQLKGAIKMLIDRFDKSKVTMNSSSLKITNPYIDEDEEQQAKNLNKQSQATLRGSVGGVTAITELITAANNGEIGRFEAVQVVKNIYGFTKKQAELMIGGFDENGDLIVENIDKIVDDE